MSEETHDEFTDEMAGLLDKVNNLSVRMEEKGTEIATKHLRGFISALLKRRRDIKTIMLTLAGVLDDLNMSDSVEFWRLAAKLRK